MRSEWTEYTVQQLIDEGLLEEPLDGNHGGIHPKASDYVPSGIPFIMANNIINGSVDYKNCVFISEKQASTLRKGFAKPGDVLLTHKATIGRTAIVPPEYPTIVLTPQVTYYRIMKGINNKYLKYYFDSSFFQQILANWAGSGSTRAYLGITAQHKLPVILPSLSTQNKIASILYVLDAKIELNNQINENLQQQAQAIFERYSAEASTEVPFTKYIDVLGGGTPKTSNSAYWDGSIPFFTPKDAQNPYVFTTIKYITEDGLNNCNSRLYPVNTTFVTARGTVGKVSLAGISMAMNQSCYALASKTLHPLLVYFYTLQVVRSLKHKATGAVFDAIITKDFETEKIRFISEESMQQLLSVIEPMFNEIHTLMQQNQRLSHLRDTLLPKLMSGELDVYEVNI